jgi:cobyrinic acid a,c-diamide synthase
MTTARYLRLATTKPGRMKVLGCLEKPEAVRKILRHLGLRDTPLPVQRSRGSQKPHLDFDFAA